MPLVKCVVTENDRSKAKHIYYPLSSIIRLEGDKKPDTLDATFQMQNKVKEGYEISYIQDIIDTTYLRAVYPMQLSCLDESGNDQDPDTDPLESRFTNVTSGRYKGHYALNFTADAQGVHITDVDKIDISKQFDIHIKFTPSTTQLRDRRDEPLLWSFMSRDVGLAIGITGTNGNDDSWKVYMRVHNGSFTEGYIGATEGLIMTGESVHIRCKRGQDDIIRVYVNGQEDITETIPQNLQPSGTNMIFGDSRNTTRADEYSGLIHEVKIYCGTDLTEYQADQIRSTKPIVQYMKFSGRVRKITSNQVTNKVTCQSNSFMFTKGKLGTIGGTDLVSHNFSIIPAVPASERPRVRAMPAIPATPFKTILQSAINHVGGTRSSDFTVRHLDTFAESRRVVHNLTGDIFEIGSFMSFVNILLLLSDTIMYVTPRKNVIIETKSTIKHRDTSRMVGKITDYIFDQNGKNIKYNIKGSEANDVKLINEVILTGRLIIDTNVDPVNPRRPSPDNVIRTFVSRASSSPISGIVRTLRRNIAGLNVKNDLVELANRTRIDIQGSLTNDTAPTKYIIKSPAPIHHIKFNHIIKIKRKNGRNDASIRPLTNPRVKKVNLDEYLVVKQIELHYPSGHVIVKVGENDIDFYDDTISTTNVTDGLVDDTLFNKEIKVIDN